jgi:hypothetical protein
VNGKRELCAAIPPWRRVLLWQPPSAEASHENLSADLPFYHCILQMWWLRRRPRRILSRTCISACGRIRANHEAESPETHGPFRPTSARAARRSNAPRPFGCTKYRRWARNGGRSVPSRAGISCSRNAYEYCVQAHSAQLHWALLIVLTGDRGMHAVSVRFKFLWSENFALPRGEGFLGDGGLGGTP